MWVEYEQGFEASQSAILLWDTIKSNVAENRGNVVEMLAAWFVIGFSDWGVDWASICVSAVLEREYG